MHSFLRTKTWLTKGIANTNMSIFSMVGFVDVYTIDFLNVSYLELESIVQTISFASNVMFLQNQT